MNALVSISDVKSFMDILSTDYDSFITHLVSVASQTIETYCQQPIKNDLVTESFYGNGSTEKDLDYFPVNSINAITYETETNGAWVAVDSEDYQLYSNRKSYHVINDGGFTRGYPYHIGAYVGYNAVPYDVQQVAIEMAAMGFANSGVRGESRLGVDSITNNVINTTTTTKYLDLNNAWKKRLDSYRKITC
jgi:hypothetical protein